MTLYHGSYVSVPAPLTGVGRRELDFGPGFYVTSIREQAERWARRVCVIRAVNTPLISTYEFDETALPSGVSRLRLEHYDKEWLDFIVACRGLHDSSDWDLVVGGVANDKVFDTLEAFFDGFATKEQTIDKLRMQEPNLQMCFRTAAALKTLTFAGGEEP